MSTTERELRGNIEKRNLRNRLLLIVAVFICYMMAGSVVYADGDTTAPYLTKISIKSVSVEDIIARAAVEMEVVEDETGISSISFTIGSPYGDTIYIANIGCGFETGQITSTISEVFSGIISRTGDYYISQIDVTDFAGNSRSYGRGNGLSVNEELPEDSNGVYFQDLSNAENRCYLDGTDKMAFLLGTEATLPGMLSFNLMNESLNRGEELKFEAVFESQESFTSFTLELFCKATSTSQQLNLPCTMNGTVITGSVMLPATMPPGKYDIMGISFRSQNNVRVYTNIALNSGLEPEYLKDGMGNKCILTGFKAIQVNSSDGKIDPYIKELKFLTTAIKKPGVLKIQLTVGDDTGISRITASGLVYYEQRIKKSGQEWSGVHSVPVSTSAANGSYHVDRIEIMDTDGNKSIYTLGMIWGDGGINVWKPHQDENGYYAVSAGGSGDKVYYSGSPYFTVEDEFDVAFEIGLANPNILNHINSMQEGQAGKIRIESSKKADKSLFEAIQGKDKTLIFYYNNYQWVFNGKDIVNPKTVDLTTTFTAPDGANYGTAGKVLQISFAENGELPGRANIRIKSDYTKTIYDLTNDMYLYYCNTDKNQMELESDSDINYYLDGSDNWCSFYITHNSKFVATGNKLEQTAIPAKIGKKIKVKGVTYKVLNGLKLEYVKPKNKKVKSVTIPKTVKYRGITYKVSRIADKAFSGYNKLQRVTIGANIEKIGKKAFYNAKRLTSITVKTKKLTSNRVGSSAFKGIASNATIKVPKSKLKSYKKMLLKKGVAKTVKIKK